MWSPQPASPPSPAKEATARCIDSPSLDAAEGVAAAAAQPDCYPDVVEELADNLTALTADWRKLRNALWLIEHLLACTPQLMDDLCAEPGMLRALLGFWAEDESGYDCGKEVRMRASALLGQLEAHEQMLVARRCALGLEQPWQQQQPLWQQQAWQIAQAEQAQLDTLCQQHFQQQLHTQQQAAQCFGGGVGVGRPQAQHLWAEDDIGCSPTASEDSATSTCSPFAETRENGRSHRPAGGGFGLPGLKLPKLRAIKTAVIPAAAPPAEQLAAAAAASAVAATKSSLGKPPLASGSLRSFKSSSLHRASGSAARKNSSVELVAAWGQIRGQNSSDFARMLQALDDQCFDAAQLEYERLQRPCGF